MKSGVYRIRHLASGQCYIGGSVDIVGRWSHHRCMLRQGRHKTKALQDRWDKDGESAFVFEVLEFCPEADVRAREDHWFTQIKSIFNSAPGALTGLYSGGPSDVKKAAALKRWARPDYRDKRLLELKGRRDDKGRLT